MVVIVFVQICFEDSNYLDLVARLRTLHHILLQHHLNGPAQLPIWDVLSLLLNSDLLIVAEYGLSVLKSERIILHVFDWNHIVLNSVALVEDSDVLGVVVLLHDEHVGVLAIMDAFFESGLDQLAVDYLSLDHDELVDQLSPQSSGSHSVSVEVSLESESDFVGFSFREGNGFFSEDE